MMICAIGSRWIAVHEWADFAKEDISGFSSRRRKDREVSKLLGDREFTTLNRGKTGLSWKM